MASLTAWYFTMGWMAFRTGKGGMLGRVGLQHGVHLAMTTSAQFLVLSFRIGNSKWCMNRVAGKTVSSLKG